MKLVIVESPTKARTLGSFLKKDYQIEASLGHVRDLPKKNLGVDIENNFKPDYVVLAGKKKRVKELRELAEKAEKIILATDSDREGEAIAYHVAVLLLGKKSTERNKTYKTDKTNKEIVRIVFHEITKAAVEKALENPRGIDRQLVDAQQARRILDRLVGYKLSPLLWKKLSRRWLSAGRVQSVAVRLIVEREREREKFKEEEYWKINSKFEIQNSKQIRNSKSKIQERHPEFISGSRIPKQVRNDAELVAELIAKNGEKYEKRESLELFDGKYQVTKTRIKNKAQAEEIVNDLKDDSFKVKSLDKKKIKRGPPPPFTTSSLQQTSYSRLRFSSKRTMSLAQRLYEKGLITYHRTDSVFLANKFLKKAQQFIKKRYGEKYALKKPRRFKTKSKLAQEAHEAIRPTSLAVRGSRPQSLRSSFGGRGFDPSTELRARVRGDLNRDHQRLYDLIFKRAVASQAQAAVMEKTKLEINSKKGYLFEARGSILKFDGFLKILGAGEEDKILPELKEGDKLKLLESFPTQHFTSPPPRYTEASLIKSLEKQGIGRPSTYAPIVSTITSRHYIQKEKGKFLPTSLGEAVNDFLVKNFPEVIDIPFTSQMEDNLDGIAQGKKEWLAVIKEFYEPFEKKLEKAYKKAGKVDLPVKKTGEKCPQCGAELVVKIGKYGKFLACSAFPDCKYTAPYLEKTGLECPQCGAEIVIKKTKKGKRFYGCSRWPKCEFASWKKPKKIRQIGPIGLIK